MLQVEKAYIYEALDFIDKLDSLNLEILKIPYQINNSLQNQPYFSYLIVLNVMIFSKENWTKESCCFNSGLSDHLLTSTT